jgi:hypothetical protein
LFEILTIIRTEIRNTYDKYLDPKIKPFHVTLIDKLHQDLYKTLRKKVVLKRTELLNKLSVNLDDEKNWIFRSKNKTGLELILPTIQNFESHITIVHFTNVELKNNEDLPEEIREECMDIIRGVLKEENKLRRE